MEAMEACSEVEVWEECGKEKAGMGKVERDERDFMREWRVTKMVWNIPGESRVVFCVSV